ncbi:uncharacterized protein LOC118191817 isoform X3 [Stegodyphus dumicola]|uniref:uncharacterized protein LOC118191817 isoform X3 n=1 Tax=Stegodyphus dumicola TaxID=202533 RepID=UPI0015B0254A|nr:uncharacterized protein LOC118191817 isoform X3 [Stegodyphus dumicola]
MMPYRGFMLDTVVDSHAESTLRKAGGSDGRLEKEAEEKRSGSPSLWRLLWQPGWHPRGGSTVIPNKLSDFSSNMGESSDGNGEGHGCEGGPTDEE